MKEKNNGAGVVGAILFVVFVLIAFVAVSSPRGSSESSTTTNPAKTTQSIPKKNGKIKETKTESVGYQEETVQDGNLEYGKTEVRQYGSNGSKIITYEVEYKDDVEISRNVIGEEISIQPKNKITATGTKIKWTCYDVTSYDYNWNNDMKCTSSTGEIRYTSYAGARQLQSL